MTLDGLVYQAIVSECERMEHDGRYQGNAHHLAKLLSTYVTVALLTRFPELPTAMRLQTRLDEQRPIVRRATDDEQHAAIIAAARASIANDGATHDCGEWVAADGRCELCDRRIT